MLRYLLFALILTVRKCKAWEIGANQKIVTLTASTQVTINCHPSPSTDGLSPNIKDLYRLRIMKYNDENKWSTVAEMKKNDTDVETPFHDVTSSGHVDEISESYIKMQFDTGSMNAVGIFVCEIDGVDKASSMKVIRTTPVVVADDESLSCPSNTITIDDVNEAEEDGYLEMNKKLGTFQQSIDTKQKALIDLMHKLNPEDSCGRQKCEQFITPECADSSWIVVDNKCLKFMYDSLKSWDDARKTCHNMGAHLIVLKKYEDFHAIRNYLDRHDWWLGVHFTNNKWTYDDGTTMAGTYNPWAIHEPNNNNGDEWCVQMWADGTWNDERCYWKIRFICQQKPVNFK